MSNINNNIESFELINDNKSKQSFNAVNFKSATNQSQNTDPLETSRNISAIKRSIYKMTLSIIIIIVIVAVFPTIKLLFEQKNQNKQVDNNKTFQNTTEITVEKNIEKRIIGFWKLFKSENFDEFFDLVLLYRDVIEFESYKEKFSLNFIRSLHDRKTFSFKLNERFREDFYRGGGFCIVTIKDNKFFRFQNMYLEKHNAQSYKEVIWIYEVNNEDLLIITFRFENVKVINTFKRIKFYD